MANDTDIHKLVTELANNYPKWIQAGFAKSPHIISMEKSLSLLAKQKGVDSKTTQIQQKAAEKLVDAFDEAAGAGEELAKNLDNAAAGTKKSIKVNIDALGNHSKAILGHTAGFANTLRNSGLGAATKEISGSIFEMGKATGGFTGMLTETVGLLGSGLGEFIKIVEDNNKAFYDLTELGINVGDSFTGIAMSAANANLSVADYSKVLADNADIIAITGDIGTKSMSSFIKTMQHGDKSVFKLGYSLGQATEELGTWMHIQKASGTLNTMNDAQKQAGFQNFLENIGDLSSAIGISRKEIADSMLKAANDPLWQTYAMMHKESADVMNKAAGEFTSIAGKDTGEALTKLVQEFVVSGAATSDASRKFQENLSAADGPLLALAHTTAENIKNGKATSDLQIKTADALRQTNVVTVQSMLMGDESNASMRGLASSTNIAIQTTDEKIRQNIIEGEKTKERNASLAEFDNAIAEIENALKMAFIGLLGKTGPEMNVTLKKITSFIDNSVIPSIKQFGSWLQDLADPDMTSTVIENIMNKIGDAFQDIIHDAIFGKRSKDAQDELTQQRKIRDEANAIHLTLLKQQKRTMDEKTGIGTPGGEISYPSTPATGVDRQTAIIKKTLEREGGGKITNIAGDRGGVTKYGISEKSGLSPNQIKNLTEEQAIAIYKHQYWDKAGVGNMPPEMQLEAFDTSVNMGPGRAKEFAAKSGGDVNAFAGMRQQFYQNLAASDPSQQKFLKGWTNRNNDVLATSESFAGMQDNTAAAAPTAAQVATDITPAPSTPATSGTAATPADPLLIALTQQVNLLKDAVDKLNMIAVNTSTSNDHMKNMTAEIKNNSVNT